MAEVLALTNAKLADVKSKLLALKSPQDRLRSAQDRLKAVTNRVNETEVKIDEHNKQLAELEADLRDLTDTQGALEQEVAEAKKSVTLEMQAPPIDMLPQVVEQIRTGDMDVGQMEALMPMLAQLMANLEMHTKAKREEATRAAQPDGAQQAPTPQASVPTQGQAPAQPDVNMTGEGVKRPSEADVKAVAKAKTCPAGGL